MSTRARLVEIYQWVRSLPYDTVAAHDAEGLRTQGRGNCAAKAGLLAEELSSCGAACRTVSWEYELPDLGPVVVLDRHGRSSQLDEVVARIGRQVEATDPDLIAQYQRDLNQLFEQARSEPPSSAKGRAPGALRLSPGLRNQLVMGDTNTRVHGHEGVLGR